MQYFPQSIDTITAWGQSLQSWSITQIVAGVLIVLLAATVLRKVLRPIRYVLFLAGLFMFSKGLIDITLLNSIGQTLWTLIQSVVSSLF